MSQTKNLQPPPPATPQASPRLRFWPFLALALILAFSIGVRLRLLDAPLERDEGEYAYAGQLMLEGVPPYAGVYNMKAPGVYAAYAVILAVFGQTHQGIHFALLLINTATIILVYLLGRQLVDDFVGVGAAAVFAVLSASQAVQGIFANAEHFVLLFAMAGLLVLLRAIKAERKGLLALAGGLFGAAFLMKQHGAALGAFAGIYLLLRLWQRQPRRLGDLAWRAGLFVAGGLAPVALALLLLWGAGVFENFWFLAVDYAHAYVTSLSLHAGLEPFGWQLIRFRNCSTALWILTFLGLGLSWRRREQRPVALYVTLFFVFGFLSTCPGFFFREHYFILLLPAAALAATLGARELGALFAPHAAKPAAGLAAGLLALAIGISIYCEHAWLFSMDALAAMRTTYGACPFPESLPIADFLRAHTRSDEKIAIFGSEPQIFFYAHRRSATGFVYMYPLTEPQPFAPAMRARMLAEVGAVNPRYVVCVAPDGAGSWYSLYPQGPALAFVQRLLDYVQDFRCVGAIEMRSSQETVYRWGADAESGPSSDCPWVAIYERVDNPPPTR